MTTAADDLAKAARSTLDYLTSVYNSGDIDGQVGGSIIAELHSAVFAYEAARGDGVAGAVEDALYHGTGAVLVKADGSVEHIDRRAMIAAAKGE